MQKFFWGIKRRSNLEFQLTINSSSFGELFTLFCRSEQANEIQHHQESFGRNDPHWLHRIGIDSALINLERKRRTLDLEKLEREKEIWQWKEREIELKSNKMKVHVHYREMRVYLTVKMFGRRRQVVVISVPQLETLFSGA